MNDARFDALSSVLTRHSTALKPGEKVLIDAFDIPDEFVISLGSGRAQGEGHAVCSDPPRTHQSRAGA